MQVISPYLLVFWEKAGGKKKKKKIIFSEEPAEFLCAIFFIGQFILFLFFMGGRGTFSNHPECVEPWKFFDIFYHDNILIQNHFNEFRLLSALCVACYTFCRPYRKGSVCFCVWFWQEFFNKKFLVESEIVSASLLRVVSHSVVIWVITKMIHNSFNYPFLF